MLSSLFAISFFSLGTSRNSDLDNLALPMYRIQKRIWQNEFLHSLKKGILHFHGRFDSVGNGVCKSRNMTTDSVFKNSIWIAKALIYREKV